MTITSKTTKSSSEFSLSGENIILNLCKSLGLIIDLYALKAQLNNYGITEDEVEKKINTENNFKFDQEINTNLKPLTKNIKNINLKTLPRANIKALKGGATSNNTTLALSQVDPSAKDLREVGRGLVVETANFMGEATLRALREAIQSELQFLSIAEGAVETARDRVSTTQESITKFKEQLDTFMREEAAKAKQIEADCKKKLEDTLQEVKEDKNKAISEDFWQTVRIQIISFVLVSIIAYLLHSFSDNVAGFTAELLQGTFNTSLQSLTIVSSYVSPTAWNDWWKGNDTQLQKTVENTEAETKDENNENKFYLAVEGMMNFIIFFISLLNHILLTRLGGIMTGRNQLTSPDSEKNIIRRGFESIPFIGEGAKIAEGTTKMFLLPMMLLIGFPYSDETKIIQSRATKNNLKIQEEVQNLTMKNLEIQQYFSEKGLMNEKDIRGVLLDAYKDDPTYTHIHTQIDNLTADLVRFNQAYEERNENLHAAQQRLRLLRESHMEQITTGGIQTMNALISALHDVDTIGLRNSSAAPPGMPALTAPSPPEMPALPPAATGATGATGGNRKKSKKRKNKKNKNKSKNKNKNKRKKSTKKRKRKRKTHRK
jgi:hypothetical protein